MHVCDCLLYCVVLVQISYVITLFIVWFQASHVGLTNVTIVQYIIVCVSYIGGVLGGSPVHDWRDSIWRKSDR